jgi:hypothetical protein
VHPPAAPALPPLEAWVQLDAHARMMPAAALDGDFVVNTEALHHPALDVPMSHFGPLPAAQVLQPLRAPLRVGELLQCWRRLGGETAAVQLFAQLWRQRVVVASTGAATGAAASA